MATEEKEKLRQEENGENGAEPHEQVFTPEPLETETIGLKKNVTLINGIGLIVGSIIGSGIFISPTGVIKRTGSVGMSLIVWLLCGMISMFGALCYGELGTTIRKSGAEYAYLKEAFGPVPAFLFGWTGVLIIRPSAVAGIALVFAEYVVKPFYPDCTPPMYLIKMLSFVCIGKLTAVFSSTEFL